MTTIASTTAAAGRQAAARTATEAPAPAVAPASGKAGAAAGADSELANSRAALATDFDTFLTLLTAQMKNQDPTKPIESTEFVAQLAQFSSVEQQIASNTTLTAILEAINATGAGSLAEWLGKEVRAQAPAPYAGKPIDVYPEPATIAAKTATLVVTDAEGAVVAEQTFTPGASAVSWDGTVKGGGKAGAGTYGFAVRYGAEKGETETAGASVYTRVVEARIEKGEALLMLAGGGSVPAKDVTGVRNPGA
jgi:flagellar basal-body rod modification protein FlgD